VKSECQAEELSDSGEKKMGVRFMDGLNGSHGRFGVSPGDGSIGRTTCAVGETTLVEPEATSSDQAHV
jgi:hypothetical protein